LKLNFSFGTLIISREGKTFPLVPEAGYADRGLSPLFFSSSGHTSGCHIQQHKDFIL